MWAVKRYLARAQLEIDANCEYRYSRLELVFGRLLREKRIEEGILEGLAGDKLARMRRVASL